MIESNLMEEEKLKIESLKFISTEHRKLLAGRISQEWKIIVLVLTYYVGLASSKTFIVVIDTYIIFCSTTIPALVSCCFLYFLHQANVINKGFAHAAESAMIKFIEIGVIKYEKPKEDKKWFLKDRNLVAFLWQSVIIVSFAVVSFYVVNR